MTKVDMRLDESIDGFFGDSNRWRRAAAEVVDDTWRLDEMSSRGPLGVTHPSPQRHVAERQFRVDVPEPYPGVRYRWSKAIDDRHPSFAKSGAIVSGRLENRGDWLRLSNGTFLPARVGPLQVLVPLDSRSTDYSRESDCGCDDRRLGGRAVVWLEGILSDDGIARLEGLLSTACCGTDGSTRRCQSAGAAAPEDNSKLGHLMLRSILSWRDSSAQTADKSADESWSRTSKCEA